MACCTSGGTSDQSSLPSLSLGLFFMIFRGEVVGGKAVVVGHITYALMITISPSQPT